MNPEQKEVISENVQFATDFIADKKQKLLAKNHIVGSSAGIDTRQIKGEFETMHKKQKYLVRFAFSISAHPVT